MKSEERADAAIAAWSRGEASLRECIAQAINEAVADATEAEREVCANRFADMIRERSEPET
jgi:hypothetical protein